MTQLSLGRFTVVQLACISTYKYALFYLKKMMAHPYAGRLGIVTELPPDGTYFSFLLLLYCSARVNSFSFFLQGYKTMLWQRSKYIRALLMQ